MDEELLKRLKKLSVVRSTFEDGDSKKMGYSNEGTNENKFLPGPSRSSHHRSQPGSCRGFTEIKLDAQAAQVSYKDSKSDQNSADSVGSKAMFIRDKLLMNQGLQAKETKNIAEKKQEIKQCKRTQSLDHNEYQNENPSTIREPIATRRRILKKHAGTYELEKYRKKAMIIFNHQDFLGGAKSTRHGTLRDEETLKATFEMFGFDVEAHLDLTKKELLEKLKTFCLKDFTQYGCVCAAVLTHGSMPENLCAYDTRYSEYELRECFNVHFNPTLFGKPIIILIQACRGDKPASACRPVTVKHEMGGVVIDSDPSDDHYKLPTESDMLIFHSSYIGRASLRDENEGSWFIQTLCKQIKLLADTTDFESICKAVRKEVALEKEHNMIIDNEPTVAKQMPVVTSTLLRDLYLRKYYGLEDTDEDDELNEMPQDEVPTYDEDPLVDFVQSANAEYLWLLKKEQVEVSRNWADPHIDLPAVQHYYEHLMSSLEKRELQFSNVVDRGEALIAQHHPSTVLIKFNLQEMQSQWESVMQLMLCLETHLKHTTQYHNFFGEVQEAEKWIQKCEEAVKSKTNHFEFTLDHGESLLKDMQELREEINSHGTVVSRLINEAQTIRPLKQRRAPVTRPLMAETVCAYKEFVAIEKGMAVMVVENSDDTHWLVRLGGSGIETHLLAAMIALYPPCTEAQDAATRLRNAYDRVIQLWQMEQIHLRQDIMFVTFKVVMGWNFQEFVAMGAERRRTIQQALNEDAERLLAEGDPSHPLLRRLRRELQDINKLFEEPDWNASSEEGD